MTHNPTTETRTRSEEVTGLDSPDPKCTKPSLPKSGENPPKPEEQTYKNYILNNIRNLINDRDLNDVTFIVEREELYGIRTLFSSQSMVFRQMLYGSMMESNPENKVFLNDMTVDTFKYLRDSFYNLNPTLTSSIVVDVLFAAQKYIIEPLVQQCIHFMKNISAINDWYFVLNKLESSEFQIQSKLYMNQIINDRQTPKILESKSIQFLENEQFKHLKHDTLLILINSDNLAVKEHEIWDALLVWAEYNSQNKECIADDSKEFEENSEFTKDIMSGFVKYVRFNQMDATYFKTNIVDKSILSANDIINIMFCRENPSKWKLSKFNDNQRTKPKPSNSFQLSEVCLSLKEIRLLQIGDLIDFRDIYGLFCSATIMETNHSQNKFKIHYNAWGSTYDEWYVYVSSAAESQSGVSGNESNNADLNDRIVLKQTDLNFRIAQYGSITNRNVKREHFSKQIAKFNKNSSAAANNKIEVQLPPLFWKKNEDYITNKSEFTNKWLNAKIIAYKTNSKYSNHIKIGMYINDDHFEYWLHPDNEQEVRQIDDNQQNYI